MMWGFLRGALSGLVLVSVLLFIAGCITTAPIPPTFASGRDVATEHNVGQYSWAHKGAAEYCAGLGLGVRFLGTSGAPPVSRFECVSQTD